MFLCTFFHHKIAILGDFFFCYENRRKKKKKKERKRTDVKRSIHFYSIAYSVRHMRKRMVQSSEWFQYQDRERCQRNSRDFANLSVLLVIYVLSLKIFQLRQMCIPGHFHLNFDLIFFFFTINAHATIPDDWKLLIILYGRYYNVTCKLYICVCVCNSRTLWIFYLQYTIFSLPRNCSCRFNITGALLLLCFNLTATVQIILETNLTRITQRFARTSWI